MCPIQKLSHRCHKQTQEQSTDPSTAQLLGVLGVPTNTQARLGSSTIKQMFISQDKAKWVGGWPTLTYNGSSLAFIWVTGAPWEMQVGTICPTKNLRSACGRGEALCPAGSTVTRKALWLLPFVWTSGDCPPTLVCPKTWPHCPPASNERISGSSTSFSLNRWHAWVWDSTPIF